VQRSLASGRADEIKVVTSGGFTAAYQELVPQYEAATHNKLVTEFGPSMGTTHNAIPYGQKTRPAAVQRTNLTSGAGS
jgi:ABC-type molybdate transport system substrate-binding protein